MQYSMITWPLRCHPLERTRQLHRHEVEPWACLCEVLQHLAQPATPEELRQLFPIAGSQTPSLRDGVRWTDSKKS